MNQDEYHAYTWCLTGHVSHACTWEWDKPNSCLIALRHLNGEIQLTLWLTSISYRGGRLVTFWALQYHTNSEVQNLTFAIAVLFVVYHNSDDNQMKENWNWKNKQNR